MSGLCLCQAPGFDSVGVREGDRHLGVSMEVKDGRGWQGRHGLQMAGAGKPGAETLDSQL